MFAAALALLTGIAVAAFAAPVLGLPFAAAVGVGAALAQHAIWDDAGDDE